MKVVLLLIGLLTISPVLKSQVKGKITDRKAELLEEVLVINLNTKDTSITNEAGEYFLLKADESDVIRYEKNGYVTQEITISNQSQVDLILAKNEFIIEDALIWPRYIQVGIDYDFINSQMGFRLLSVTPNLNSFKPYIITEIEWRKPHNGIKYVQVSLKKYNLLQSDRYSDLFFEFGYQQIGIYQEGLQDTNQVIERFFLQGELLMKKTRVLLGVSNQQISNPLNRKRSLGVIIGYKVFLPRKTVFDSKLEWIGRGIQYNVVLRKTLERLKSIVEIRFERIKNYQRIGVGVNYIIGY